VKQKNKLKFNMNYFFAFGKMNKKRFVKTFSSNFEKKV